MIVDQLVRGSYGRFLNDSLFEPLGMTSTGLDDTRTVLEQRARGYESADRNADFIDMSVLYAAGGMYSTVEDLYVWNKALFAGEIVPLDVLDALWEDSVAVDVTYFEEGATYALGLFDRLHEGHRAIESFGFWAPGFCSYLVYYPDDDLVLIVLSNRGDTSVPLWWFVETTALMFFGD